MDQQVKTRFLIISDTHGEPLQHCPTDRVDVAIHCGDLTEESKLAEFKTTIEVLKQINAPLKLIIAGNHDWTLDTPVFQQKLSAIILTPTDKAVKREYGAFGEAMAVLESEDAKAHGIVYLHEGTHRFKLANGAHMTVYASPYTPSVDEWGFNYDPQHEHEWAIGNDVDVVITHSPPKGVMDFTESGQRGGSAGLFAAVAQARPKLHCFGHMHANWGAKKVTWKGMVASEEPSHFTDIDNDESSVIEALSTLRARKFDSIEDVKTTKRRKARYERQGYCDAVNLGLEDGVHTLFVNAAIEGESELEQHLPWVVDVELPRANEESATGTCKNWKRSDDDDDHDDDSDGSSKRACAVD
jgi:Icc-related predicted phosphoesterase